MSGGSGTAVSCGGVYLFLLLSFGLKVVLIEAADSFTVEVPHDQIVGRLGSTVTLPCWISPQQSAEGLEIRWYRPERFDTPVLFYRDGKIQEVQEDLYRNRSFLTLRSAQSNGLKNGDVSLWLGNLSVQDEGLFHCYVSGEKSYDSQTVTLNITALGCTPALFSQPIDDTQLNISCRSSGWFPQPKIMWMSNRRTVLSAGGTSQSRGADGTFSVHSWTLVSPSDTQQVACLLSLSSGEEKDSWMEIKAISSTDSEGPWKALFFFTLAVLCLLIGFILYKNREKFTAEKTTLSFEICKESKEEMRKNAAKFTLDPKSQHPNLTVSKDLRAVRDSKDYKWRGDGFPYELCVCGDQTFSSGRHYWEVQLTAQNSPPKEVWLIGVMKHGSNCLNRKNNLWKESWFLCSDGLNGIYINTDPPVILSPTLKPEHVGVLLDYDNGMLAFYDVKNDKHLLTMKTKFSGSVVPLFNPGAGDQVPMRIEALVADVESATEHSQLLPNETGSSA